MGNQLYTTLAWRRLRKRALERDGNRCSIGRLLGGACSDRLDVHHVIPVSEGGDPLPSLDLLLTTCSRHHPSLERIRKECLKTERQWKHCPHQHRSAQSRIECELKINAA